jgi:AraC-like DNA-binding protein
MKIAISDQFQDFLKLINVDINEILQSADIGQVLWKETIELNNSQYWRLMSALDDKISDEGIIYMSQIKKMNTFMPSFFAALTSKNGAMALKRLSEYKSLLGPVDLSVKDNGETTTIKISGEDLDFELPRFTILIEQLLMLSLLQTGTSKEIVPLKVGSCYQYGDAITNVFKTTPIKLDTNELTFDNHDLQQNFLSSNNVMWEFIRPELDRRKLENSSNKSISDNVQALLLKKIPSGEFGIDDVSNSLNISKRTLQRNLKSINTSFNEQVKYARKTLVSPLMKDATLTLEDISYLLGYADPESFSRAFKDWYDKSPSQYRKDLVI